MRTRGYRRYKKAQFKKRLIDRAIRRYNRYEAGHTRNGTFIPRICSLEEIPQNSYYQKRHILRNDGGGRRENYRCGYCEWCVANRCYNTQRRRSAQDADWVSFAAGDYEIDEEEDTSFSQ